MFNVKLPSKVYGIDLGLWAITEAHVDIDSNAVIVTISGWLDKESHDAGRLSIDKRIEKIQDGGQLDLCKLAIQALPEYKAG